MIVHSADDVTGSGFCALSFLLNKVKVGVGFPLAEQVSVTDSPSLLMFLLIVLDVSLGASVST